MILTASNECIACVREYDNLIITKNKCPVARAVHN